MKTVQDEIQEIIKNEYYNYSGRFGKTFKWIHNTMRNVYKPMNFWQYILFLLGMFKPGKLYPDEKFLEYLKEVRNKVGPRPVYKPTTLLKNK